MPTPFILRLDGVQVLVAVVMQRQQLVFPDTIDPDYAELSLRCMSYDPGARPRMEDVISTLASLEIQYREGTRRVGQVHRDTG